jgi:hypothetical protein
MKRRLNGLRFLFMQLAEAAEYFTFFLGGNPGFFNRFR